LAESDYIIDIHRKKARTVDDTLFSRTSITCQYITV